MTVFPTFRRWFGPTLSVWPLMIRELTEQSARRSTYLWRMIYGAVIYGFMLWFLWVEYGGRNTMPFEYLGQGRGLFLKLAWLQFCGLYLFLPAMTSGLLTAEKERDTLSLLLLTRLGPWSILLGKLFSRLIPMGAYVLLSLPLLAVTYTIGGLDETEILALAWTLLATALQMATLGLACSAWFRTTAGAFIATYLFGLVMIGIIPLVTNWGHNDVFGILSMLSEFLNWLDPQYPVDPAQVPWVLAGPAICLNEFSTKQPFAITAFRSIPIWGTAALFLVFSRVVLWRRAFLAPSSALLKTFRRLDALFQRMNQNRLTRGIVLIPDRARLPEWDPIRWRETCKRSLGNARYLVRMLLVLELPVVVLLLAGDHNVMTSQSIVGVTGAIVWVLSILIITVHATGLIGGERSRQTLDVLLTMPMTSEAIVKEKLAGVWRLILVLWIPFLTIFGFRVLWSAWLLPGESRLLIESTIGLIPSVVGLALYLPMVAYLGFYAGMWVRSQTRATLLVLGLILGCCTIPVVLGALFPPPLSEMLYAVSPPMVLNGVDLAGTLFHFFVIGNLVVMLRYQVYHSFAKCVGRGEGDAVLERDLDRMPPSRLEGLSAIASGDEPISSG